MSIIINTNRTASEARLRERIFNVLPAASFQMDRLLRLLDIVESDRSPTACIECAAQPRLHLNPDFIAAYCRDDESLFLLVMHELQHVVLGHTRLFGRAALHAIFPVAQFVGRIPRAPAATAARLAGQPRAAARRCHPR